MELSTYFLFLATTAVVVFSPGPAAITIAAQGSGNGVRRAQFGVFGIASANAIYFALSATGIASIIIASNALFTVIKWVGIAYLCYLGLSAIFSKTGGFKVKQGRRESARLLFTKGFVVEFANPKALLYFAAILPQFLNVNGPIALQFLIMGATTLALDFAAYSIYSFLGATVSRSGVKAWAIKSINTAAGGALLFSAFKMMRVTN